MAGGLETVQTSTLLGPSYCGRCCHSECHDPTLHTAGEKENTTPGKGKDKIKEKQPWQSDHSGYGCLLHVIYAHADPQ